MSRELATEAAGASVLAASSFDARFDPSAILRKEGGFWMTSGCYPQELVIALSEAASVGVIKTVTTNVKRMVVERCEKSIATSWEKVLDIEMEDNEGNPQLESNPLSQNPTACFLKFKILSGWSDFSAISSISVMGAGSRHRDSK